MVRNDWHGVSNFLANLLSILQLRRHARERREYIYRKAQESQEQQIYERKQKLKESLATGKLLPTELRKESQKLAKDFAYDESQEGSLASSSGIGKLPGTEFPRFQNLETSWTMSTRKQVLWTPKSLLRLQGHLVPG